METQQRVREIMRGVADAVRRGGLSLEPSPAFMCPVAMRALLDMDGAAWAAREVVAAPPPHPERMEVKAELWGLDGTSGKGVFSVDLGTARDSLVTFIEALHGEPLSDVQRAIAAHAEAGRVLVNLTWKCR